MRRILILFLLAFLAQTTSLQARPLYISMAASMTDVISELLDTYNREHPQLKVYRNSGSSGALARQIEGGAPADIFISANPDWLDYLTAANRIDTRHRVVLAGNQLVFIGREELLGVRLENIEKLNRIAIGNPLHVPAGMYTKQVLEKVGKWKILKQEHKLIQAKDVRQALLYGDRGEADGAFVYGSDARLAKNARLLFAVDPKLHAPINCSMALIANAQMHPQAIDLFNFLAGPDSVPILNRYGFTTKQRGSERGKP